MKANLGCKKEAILFYLLLSKSVTPNLLQNHYRTIFVFLKNGILGYEYYNSYIKIFQIMADIFTTFLVLNSFSFFCFPFSLSIFVKCQIRGLCEIKLDAGEGNVLLLVII